MGRSCSLPGPRSNSPVAVVAALIRQNESFLICQRPAHKARPLMWEFPGGKVEPGESDAQALIRECEEELAITLSVGDLYAEVTHTYPDIKIRLRLYECAIQSGTLTLKEHQDAKWITPRDIRQYAFCPADEDILQMLEKG